MRIDAYNQISQIYQTTERRTVGKKNSVYGSDKVEIHSLERITGLRSRQ